MQQILCYKKGKGNMQEMYNIISFFCIFERKLNYYLHHVFKIWNTERNTDPIIDSKPFSEVSSSACFLFTVGNNPNFPLTYLYQSYSFHATSPLPLSRQADLSTVNITIVHKLLF